MWLYGEIATTCGKEQSPMDLLIFVILVVRKNAWLRALVPKKQAILRLHSAYVQVTDRANLKHTKLSINLRKKKGKTTTEAIQRKTKRNN